MKYKILIADDHKLFGHGLKELLRKQGDFIPYGPEQDKDAIEEAIFQYSPTVLLLDINLGKINGLEFGKDLKLAFPYLKIIILTMFENEKMLRLSKLYGMDGYLLKDCETVVLLSGIRKVLAGETYFTTFERKETTKHAIVRNQYLEQFRLSKTEMEVIELLKNNESLERISSSLQLSPHTVKTYCKNVFLKLGIQSVEDLKRKLL